MSRLYDSYKDYALDILKNFCKPSKLRQIPSNRPKIQNHQKPAKIKCQK